MNTYHFEQVELVLPILDRDDLITMHNTTYAAPIFLTIGFN